MEKLNGKKKLLVSVFISGRGTNLKSLINFSKRKNSPIKIVLIVTQNKTEYVYQYNIFLFPSFCHITHTQRMEWSGEAQLHNFYNY